MLEKEALKVMFENKKVYADLSVLSDVNFIDFINENYLWLKESGKRIIVHKGIKEAIKNLVQESDKMKIGLAVVDYLEQHKMIEYFGDENSVYAPLGYLVHFVSSYLYDEIAVLTNDENLYKDIIAINCFSAIRSLKRIMVYRVNNNGKIGMYLNYVKERYGA